MRIDHFAYQRAFSVALFGLVLQATLAILIGVTGFINQDHALIFSSGYVTVGIFAWLALVVVFHQHKLERLESIEIDELVQSRMGSGSAFDTDDAGLRVQQRRLNVMHKWLMPLVSLLIAGLLTLFAILILWWFGQQNNPDPANEIADFNVAGALRPWVLAGGFSIALVAFIFSRYVAGMARLTAWHNLRGGAGFMVGNALVALALAIGAAWGIINETTDATEVVAHALPFFMLVIAAEIVLNFLLNLYRPRRAGETPRPAFDSKLLSLLSAPDTIVRSINEAINYQFGFDITSSWGYQLLMKRMRALVLFAVAILILLNMMVVVEPHQRAVILRGGEIRGDRAYTHFTWKLPWPFERAEVYNVSRIRELPLTAQYRDPANQPNKPFLWSEELDENLGFEPFLVATMGIDLDDGMFDRLGADPDDASTFEALQELNEEGTEGEEQAERISDDFALIEAEIVLYYRIREDGLLDYLNFANEVIERRQRLTTRERALKELAVREVTQYASQQQIEALMSSDAPRITTELRDHIQQSFDDAETGVEVISVAVPWLRPAGAAATTFEELAFNRQQKKQRVAQGEKIRRQSLTLTAGSVSAAERILAEIAELDALVARAAEAAGEGDENDQAEQEARALVAAQEERIAELMAQSGGDVASIIADGRADRWLQPLEELAQARRFEGRLAAYRQGPEVYREYLLMDTLMYTLGDARKFFLLIDPEEVNWDIEILEDDASFIAEDALQSPEDGS